MNSLKGDKVKKVNKGVTVKKVTVVHNMIAKFVAIEEVLVYEAAYKYLSIFLMVFVIFTNRKTPFYHRLYDSFPRGEK